MIFEHNDRIVFTGDSVTDSGRKRPYGEGLWEGLGNGFVRNVDSILTTLYPENVYRIVNTGSSGFTSRDLLNTWEHDVTALKPDWVFVMIGMNDVWRQFDEPTVASYEYVSPEEFRANLTEMVRRTKDSVKGMFLMPPFYMEANDADPMKVRLRQYGAIMQQVAEENGVGFIDMQSDFDELLKHRYPASISWDRVHPSWVGSMVMARRVLHEIGCDRAF
ncbi:MAG: SGNH/GDSL hydrolase family protein [Clostridia bacterium]|nr:SGNH/GDSL hydrolase family protein [Clostridia bacterium]